MSFCGVISSLLVASTLWLSSECTWGYACNVQRWRPCEITSLASIPLSLGLSGLSQPDVPGLHTGCRQLWLWSPSAALRCEAYIWVCLWGVWPDQWSNLLMDTVHYRKVVKGRDLLEEGSHRGSALETRSCLVPTCMHCLCFLAAMWTALLHQTLPTMMD